MSEASKIPDGWHLRTLREFGDWSGGQTPLKSNPKYWQDGNILWISPKDVTGSIITDSEDRITSTALQESRLRLYPVESIMIVVRSGILRNKFPVTRCTKEFTVNQDLKFLAPDDTIDSDFVHYVLDHLGPLCRRRNSNSPIS